MRAIGRPGNAVLALALALALANCRCRTRYEPAVTAECHSFAAAAMEAKREAGTYDGLEFKRICEDCCHTHGLSAVDPGPCECGDLGIDVLLK